MEGRWQTCAVGDAYTTGAPRLPWLGGVTAARLIEALEPLADVVHTEHLTDPALWGRPIQDERYVVIARPTTSAGPGS